MAVNRIAAALKEYASMQKKHEGSIRYDLTITEMKAIKNQAVTETLAVKGTPGEGVSQNAILGSSFYSAVSIAFSVGFALGHRAAVAERRGGKFKAVSC